MTHTFEFVNSSAGIRCLASGGANNSSNSTEFLDFSLAGDKGPVRVALLLLNHREGDDDCQRKTDVKEGVEPSSADDK